jgi:CDP-4-dehydro-6-deoxyglucose reductase
MTGWDPWTPTIEQAPYRIAAVMPRTPAIVGVEMEPMGDALSYRPGQYVLLEDEDAAVAPRSFSIANAPRADGRLSLLVTRVPGGQASTWVHDRLRAGDQVRVSGAYGAFVEEPGSVAPALFLAAGSGLAPIKALLEAALPSTPRPSLTLAFSARTQADVIDAERWTAWQEREPRFRFVRTLTRGPGPPPRGRIPSLLADLVDGLGDHDVFIAGASGFVVDCTNAAQALGAARARIHTEVFYGEPQPWTGEPGFNAGCS